MTSGCRRLGKKWCANVGTNLVEGVNYENKMERKNSEQYTLGTLQCRPLSTRKFSSVYSWIHFAVDYLQSPYISVNRSLYYRSISVSSDLRYMITLIDTHVSFLFCFVLFCFVFFWFHPEALRGTTSDVYVGLITGGVLLTKRFIFFFNEIYIKMNSNEA